MLVLFFCSTSMLYVGIARAHTHSKLYIQQDAYKYIHTLCICLCRCYDRAAYQFKGERAVFNIPDYNYAHDPFILVCV